MTAPLTARVVIDLPPAKRMTEFEKWLADGAKLFGTNLQRSPDPRMPLHYRMEKRYQTQGDGGVNAPGSLTPQDVMRLYERDPRYAYEEAKDTPEVLGPEYEAWLDSLPPGKAVGPGFTGAVLTTSAKADSPKESYMGIIAKEKGGTFQLAPAGTHIAVCNIVADLGLQPTGYGPKHKVYFRFELPNERSDYEKDGQKVSGPMSTGSSFTVSLSKKATLRTFLESWRGKPFTKEELDGFDLLNVLGAPCQINIVHEPAENGNTYANIKAIMPLPKGMARPKAENPLLKYSPDDAGDFQKLPEWLQKKIKEQVSSTPEDTAQTSAASVPFEDDDIPFSHEAA